MSGVLKKTTLPILTIHVELISIHLGTMSGLVMANSVICGFNVNIGLCKSPISSTDVVSYASSTAADMTEFVVLVFHGLLKSVHSVL